MSLQEFREIFQREIESHLRSLQRKSLEKAPSAAPSELGSLPSSPAASSQEAAGPGHVPERLDELRQLASQMAANTLQRLATHAPEWGLEDATAEQAGLRGEGQQRGAPAGRGSAARSRLEARCLELEEEVRRKREEAAQREEELFAKCKAEFASVLNTREQELVEVQNLVSSDALAPQDADCEHKERLRREFAEHMDLIRSRLDAARRAVDELDGKKKGLEKIESLQRREPSAVEELLAQSCGPVGANGGAEEDDRLLLGAIEKGEQVCKRLRRYISGA